MYGLDDKVSTSDQIHWMTYHFGPAAQAPRFAVCQCPSCGSEFVNVIRANELEKELICNGCFQYFRVSIGAARSA